MPLYICRWQNGDFSAAYASNRTQADFMFDEVGNADECQVFVASDFLVHFKLKDSTDGPDDWQPFELESFGEAFLDRILGKGYPFFEKVMMSDEPSDEALEAVIRHEKKRLWGSKKPRLSSDPAVRALQKGVNAPLSVIKAVSKQRRKKDDFAKRMLDSIPRGSKPQ